MFSAFPYTMSRFVTEKNTDVSSYFITTTAGDRAYYPRTKGLPWAKRESAASRNNLIPPSNESPGSEDKANIVGSYGQFYSIQKEGVM